MNPMDYNIYTPEELELYNWYKDNVDPEWDNRIHTTTSSSEDDDLPF